MNRVKKGFTMVELLVVIAIVSMLARMAVLSRAREAARKQAVTQQAGVQSPPARFLVEDFPAEYRGTESFYGTSHLITDRATGRQYLVFERYRTIEIGKL